MSRASSLLRTPGVSTLKGERTGRHTPPGTHATAQKSARMPRLMRRPERSYMVGNAGSIV